MNISSINITCKVKGSFVNITPVYYYYFAFLNIWELIKHTLMCRYEDNSHTWSWFCKTKLIPTEKLLEEGQI